MNYYRKRRVRSNPEFEYIMTFQFTLLSVVRVELKEFGPCDNCVYIDNLYEFSFCTL